MNEETKAFFNGLAPHWDDHADDDLAFVRGLLEPLGIQKGERVLDLGCGTGVITGLLHELSGTPVLGLDLSPEMIERAKTKYQGVPNVSFEAADFMDWDGGRFDVIVIYNAYPHFVDVSAFIEALKMHITPKGRFAIVHSLGRERLSAHHHGLSPKVSRELLPIYEEILPYRDSFEITYADEGKDHYVIVGKAK